MFNPNPHRGLWTEEFYYVACARQIVRWVWDESPRPPCRASAWVLSPNERPWFDHFIRYRHREFDL